MEPAAGMNTARPALVRARGHSPSKIVLFASRARTRPLRTLARAPSWPARAACAAGCAGYVHTTTADQGKWRPGGSRFSTVLQMAPLGPLLTPSRA